MKHLRILLLSLIASTLCQALNYTAIQLCQELLLNCTMGANLDNHSNYCVNPYITCVNNNAFSHLNKPLDCYLAESGWKNVDYTCYFSFGVFCFSNIMWPGLLKFVAHKITSCAKKDPNEHTCQHSTGECLLLCSDTNRDGEVSATELSFPQAFITFASASLPILPLINANDAQARCNYALQELLVNVTTYVCN